MKKLKMFLPSIAMIVVLAFSITIGVYAASEARFSIGATVSFSSPDIGATIYCYVNQKDETIEHTWNNVNEDGTYRGDNVEGYTMPWDLNTETLSFSGTDGKNSTLTLNFEIVNKSPMSIYAYIADVATEEIVSTTKNFNGKRGTENLVTATAGEVVSIAPATDDAGTTATTMLTITFALNKNVIFGEQVDISSLGWQVRLSKFNPISE